ncbi:hypothetical protein HRG_006387 [Hirsutella rhossiliensis]|uniref:Uncharacterized protein n=1 Tax=Hirsutella rhossiliensis TaxID=111463 RepID=A0A9P8SI62_9HYPO|nr:uncharacterized protein HRG_06387 [Hirsutella rhossiliensis]KAH0962285.1 hypothetical protein HRG_06387 [Hirsutella rhossiliensis]
MCRGYQEVTHLPDGRIIAVSTYGGCLVLVTHNGEGVTDTKILYKSKFDEKTKPFPAGTGAIDQINATAYLFNDQSAKTLNILDTEKNTTTQVKLLNGLDQTGDDGLAVPKRFQGKCAVVAAASEGWFFWCSRDGWHSAELIDTIENKYANGGAGEGDLATKNGSSTAIYEIAAQGETGGDGNSLIFGNYEFFMDAPLGPNNETIQGTRTKFPQEDLTSRLAKFYEKFQSGAASQVTEG